jgi:hypothetical protein
MTTLLLAVLALSPTTSGDAAALPGEVGESLARSLAVPGGRIVPLSWSSSGNCRIRSVSVPRAIEGSGRFAVKYAGSNCSGWGWVRLEVWAETAVTTRALRAGEPLSSGIAIVEKEMKPGRMPFVPGEGMLAARMLPAGTMVGPADVSRSAVVAGDRIKILVMSGFLAVETQGRRVACPSPRACAVLPTGKHVEGRMDGNGRLIVEVPQ